MQIKMCVLPLLFYFLAQFLNVRCRDVVFIQDTSFRGYSCQQNKILFRVSLRKLKCAALCTENPICLSIVFDTDKTECIGCSSLTAVMETPGSNTLFYKQPSYIGCFEDMEPRILNDYQTSSQTMTTSSCINTCSSRNYAFAMTEYSSQCFCGNSGQFLELNIQRPDSECDYACSGDANEKCGGFWRASMYRTNPTTTG